MAIYAIGGTFLVNSISGTFSYESTNSAMTLLPANMYGGNDNNLFYPGSGSLLDSWGFSFVAGGVDYNIFYTSGYRILGVYGTTAATWYNDPIIPFSVSPVPEPTTLLLLGSGLLGIVAFRKNFKK